MPPHSHPPIPSMNVTCPYCHHQMGVYQSQAGSLVACHNCQGKFQVPYPNQTAPVYQQPMQRVQQLPDYQQFVEMKQPVVLVAMCLGAMGIHKFMLGMPVPALITMMVFLVSLVAGACLLFPIVICLFLCLIGFIEGLIYLFQSDEDFYRNYAVQRRPWF